MIRSLKYAYFSRQLLSESYKNRQNAARSLGVLGDARAVRSLIEVFDRGIGPDVEIAFALGRLGGAQAVEALLRILRKGGDGACAAIPALGTLNDVHAVIPLIKRLGDSNPEIRIAAAHALGKMGHPIWTQCIKGDDQDYERLGLCESSNAILPLTYALGGQASPAVRRAAAEALGNRGGEQAIDVLINALGDKDSSVHEAASQALKVLTPRAVDKLVRELGAVKSEARCAAVSKLGCLGDVQAVLPVVRMLGDSNPDVRLAAVDTLGKLGQPQWAFCVRGEPQDFERLGRCSDMLAAEPLLKALFDDASRIRSLAANALGSLGNAAATDALIKSLGDGNPTVRSSAASALRQLGQPQWSDWVRGDDQDFERLGNSGNKRASEPLIRILGISWSDQRPYTEFGGGGDVGRHLSLYEGQKNRYYKTLCDAATALGKIGDEAALPALSRLLGNAMENVRCAAVCALAELKNPLALDPMLTALQDRAPSVRRIAAESLGALHDVRSVEPLIRVLREGESDCRHAAAGSLGKLGDARAVDPLIQMLEGKWDRDRQVAASALVDLGKDARKALIRLLRTCKYDVRESIITILGKMGSSAVEPLMSALLDNNQTVRESAARVLGKLGDPRAKESLVKALSDKNRPVCYAAAEALAMLGAIEPLISALGDKDTAWAAADALAQSGDLRAVNPLFNALKRHDDLRPSVAVIEFLRRSGDKRAVTLLVTELGRREYHPNTRRAAAMGLGQLGDTCAVEPLIKALSDGDTDLRRNAAISLGQLGDARATEHLAKLFDSDYDLCGVAAEALGQLGNQDAIESLVKALREHSWYWRKAAASALVSMTCRDPSNAIQNLSQVRALITAPHEDKPKGRSSDCHNDEHIDRGIGLSFPPSLAGNDF